MSQVSVTASVMRGARHGHRGLYLFALLMGLLSAVLAVAAVVDDRAVLGAPVWLKPLKFAISFALYGGALSWLLSRLPRVTRPANVAAWAIVVSSAVEMVVIVGQAARGERSHFNTTSNLNGLLFSIMGFSITVLYVAAIVLAVSVLRQRGPDRVVTLAIKAGLVVGLAGFAVGVIMVVIGSHAVGVPDGGPGLPFVGWSTTGGDLRIGHFIGMHAVQVLPLIGASIVALGQRRWDEPTQLRLLLLAAAGYASVVALVTWQALRAQPLLQPDGLTLGAVAVVVTLLAVATTRLPGVRAKVSA